MTTEQIRTENGHSYATSAKAPNVLDDREPKENSVVSLALELFVFFLRVFYICVKSFVRIFVPDKETSVAGKKVLITGTGHGIGKELAKLYGQLGAEVVCVDLNAQTNQETVSELKKQGISCHAYTCDISSRDDVLALGERVLAEVGDVDVLINNAGIMPCKKFQDHSHGEVRKIFDVNVFAHFWTLDAFLPPMRVRNEGHVVAISSMIGLIGVPNLVGYAASKFAVRGYMEALAEEYRLEGRNIKFTTIYPFMTDTGLCKKPRLRFPSLMKLLPVEETAAAIVSAQRRGDAEVAIPPFLLAINNIVRLLPLECAKLVIDFFDSGLEPHD